LRCSLAVSGSGLYFAFKELFNLAAQARVASQAPAYSADSTTNSSVPQAKAPCDRPEVSSCHPASRIEPHLTRLTGAAGRLHQVLHLLPIGVGHLKQHRFELRPRRLLLVRGNFRVLAPRELALDLVQKPLAPEIDLAAQVSPRPLWVDQPVRYKAPVRLLGLPAPPPKVAQ